MISILLIMFLSSPAPVNSCITCHGGEAYRYSRSVHAPYFGCVDCHGGNPSILKKNAMSARYGFRSFKNKKEIAKLCAKCHSDPQKMLPYGEFVDEYKVYLTSEHGLLLFKKNDQKVAVCTDCHGKHEIRRSDDPESLVYPLKVPEVCAKCHSNEEYMKEYEIPTDQFEKYKESIHGILRMVKKDLRAPGCPDCHGVHGAVPPKVESIHEVCGKCHMAQDKFFKESPHALLPGSTKGCSGCHGHHKVVKPPHDIFTSERVGEGKGCLGCHKKGSEPQKLGEELKTLLIEAEEKMGVVGKWIEEARRKGFDVDREKIKMEEARGFVVEALTVVHSLNPSKVQEFVEDAVFASEDIKDMIKMKLIEWRDRRVMFVFNIFIFILIAILLYVKRRREVE